MEGSHRRSGAFFWVSSSNLNSSLTILRNAKLFQTTTASKFPVKSDRNILNAQECST